jgi:hypothetical protein
MLYDLKTNRWSELAQGWGSIVWSHDSRFVFLHRKHEAEPAELVRISVPDGKVQRVLDLTDVTLGGFFGLIGSAFFRAILRCSCWTKVLAKFTDSISNTDDF